MRKKIWLTVCCFVLLLFIYRGYIAKYNTYVYVSNGSNIAYDSIDFTIEIDNQEILQDTLSNTADWRLGKLYPVKIVPGYHTVCVSSKSLEYENCKKVFTIFSSKIYIGFKGEKALWEDIDNYDIFSIYKQIGRRFVIE